MDQSRINAIRARCDAATPGPWEYDSWDDLVYVNTAEEKDTPTPSIAVVDTEVNAALVSHAREDIPFLLDEVERLTRERDAAKRDLRHSDNCDICAHSIIAAGCEIECHECNLACVCVDCRNENLWQWRGPCAENGAMDE